MNEIGERIRYGGYRERIMTADEAALLFRNGMTVVTTGNPLMGYPKSTFIALSQRIRQEGGIKINLLSAGPLGPEVEDNLVDAGGIETRIGAVSGKTRAAVNRGEIRFIEGKGGQLPLQVKMGWYGPIDMAVVEAIGITPEGHIIPATAVYDTPEWLDAAAAVIVEINLRRPQGLEGLHDVYQRCGDPIPLVDNPLDRFGVPYISVNPEKIKAIVLSDLDDLASDEGKDDPKGGVIGQHILQFFRDEIRTGRWGENLPPIEVGIGNLVGAVLREIGRSEFHDFRFHMPSITDPILDIVDAGKVRWVSGMALRLSTPEWKRFQANLDRYMACMVLRPLSICNSAEVIQRLGVVAINGCLEMDLQGQVNSSHPMGTKILTGIAGAYDFSRNGLLSIFVIPSTSRGGKISSVVPMVSHVDHTEHDVDILVTEQGLADLRGLDPLARAETIIRQCAHPDYKGMLSDYLDRAKKEPGHIPVSLEESASFHLRLKRFGSMKENGS